MHRKEDGCYLCELLYGKYHPLELEEHHVFGAANRSLSEHFGLKVYLCIDHHREGKEAVHKNNDIALQLKRAGQEAFESVYPELSFRNIFGRNYL